MSDSKPSDRTPDKRSGRPWVGLLTLISAALGLVLLVSSRAPAHSSSGSSGSSGSSSSAEPSAPPTPSPSPSASSRPNKKPKPQVYVVAAMGDSLTDERSYKHSYVARLRERCPKSRFDNYGVGGNMVNQMRRRFRSEVLAKGKPDYTHLIVFGGVNDLYSDLTAGRTPKKISRDLEKMYRWGHDAGMKIVAINVSPWGGFKRYYNARRGKTTGQLNRWISRQRKTGSVDHVIDAYSLLSCGDPTRLCPSLAKPFKDGLHFGKTGHDKLVEALVASALPGCS